MSINEKQTQQIHELLGQTLGEYFGMPKEYYDAIPFSDSLLLEKHGFEARDLIFILVQMEKKLRVRIPNSVFEAEAFYTLEQMLEAFAQQVQSKEA